jgi:hypothetical protein
MPGGYRVLGGSGLSGCTRPAGLIDAVESNSTAQAVFSRETGLG